MELQLLKKELLESLPKMQTYEKYLAPRVSEGEVPEGTVVKILDEKLPWYAVRVGDRVGWMHGATLLFTDRAPTISEREPVRVITPAETYPLPRTRPTADRAYIRGPRGGCYYISGSGRKVYVDRSMCN